MEFYNIYQIGECDWVVAENEKDAKNFFERETNTSTEEYEIVIVKGKEMYVGFTGSICDGELNDRKEYILHEQQLLVKETMENVAREMIENGKEIPFIIVQIEG